MKHLLVIGGGPLPGSETPPSAVGLRTRQFLEPLVKNYNITLVLITSAPSPQLAPQQFEILRDDPQLGQKVRRIAHSGEFDAAVGINTFPSFLAAREIPENLPFWADLNGWIMAEMQAQSFELGHNAYLSSGWEQERTILLRADMLSAVSTPQKYAVLGELATFGRLNREHFSVDIVQVIPNAATWRTKASGQKIFRGKTVPEEAFLIAQIGGFNNWVDERTLFAGLEGAMTENPNIHFLSSGGQIKNVAEKPFERFQERVKASPFSDRFHLLGWVENDLMPNIYAESDLGIMVDLECPETLTGARNRLNEMMAYGLPILATRGSEISLDIARWECGHVVESGQPQGLAAAILQLKSNAAERNRLSEKALEICATLLTPEKTIRPLRSWLDQDRLELLHRFRTPLTSGNWSRKAGQAWQFGKERGIKALIKKIRQQFQS